MIFGCQTLGDQLKYLNNKLNLKRHCEPRVGSVLHEAISYL